jgi:hypothetical protein
MTTEQLKDHVRNSMQHYYNKEQVIELINKLKNESKGKGMATPKHRKKKLMTAWKDRQHSQVAEW